MRRSARALSWFAATISAWTSAFEASIRAHLEVLDSLIPDNGNRVSPANRRGLEGVPCKALRHVLRFHARASFAKIRTAPRPIGAECECSAARLARPLLSECSYCVSDTAKVRFAPPTSDCAPLFKGRKNSPGDWPVISLKSRTICDWS
jgi:hypothetical protein